MNKLTLELTLDETNLLLAGLGELPAKLSLALIEKIRSEAVSQFNLQNETVAPPVETEAAN
jgi:hypothetical protein